MGQRSSGHGVGVAVGRARAGRRIVRGLRDKREGPKAHRYSINTEWGRKV